MPDFPKPGIVFKDITPLLADGPVLAAAIDLLADYARERSAELVLAAEARGFVLGAAVAARTGIGFVPARKPGRLPREARSVSYALEYGEDTLEVHADAIPPGTRVLVLDDLIATGGTAQALCRHVEASGARVAGCAFLVELAFLDGRDRLGAYDVHSLVTYDEP